MLVTRVRLGRWSYTSPALRFLSPQNPSSYYDVSCRLSPTERPWSSILSPVAVRWSGGPRSERVRRGVRTFVLIEAGEKARTDIPGRLAETPGESSCYDFYALA
jgi:hypothetical protein